MVSDASWRKIGVFTEDPELSPVEATGGTIFLSVIRDVSEKKRAEETFRQSEQQLRKSEEQTKRGDTRIRVLYVDGNPMLL